MEKILETVKDYLGVPRTDTKFDPDLLLAINGVFLSLHQLGVGPNIVFSITGNTETWSLFLTDANLLGGAKLYLGMKVKLAFDPPSSGALMEAFRDQIKELEFRLMTEKETGAHE